MDDNTTKILTQLSDKLGTTVEHLWGVLIRQAPISSGFCLAGIILGAWITWVLGSASFKCFKKEQEEREDIYLIFGFVYGAIAFFAFIFAFASLCKFDQTIAGFFNPEYWALKELIK